MRIGVLLPTPGACSRCDSRPSRRADDGALADQAGYDAVGSAQHRGCRASSRDDARTAHHRTGATRNSLLLPALHRSCLAVLSAGGYVSRRGARSRRGLGLPSAEPYGRRRGSQAASGASRHVEIWRVLWRRTGDPPGGDVDRRITPSALPWNGWPLTCHRAIAAAAPRAVRPLARLGDGITGVSARRGADSCASAPRNWRAAAAPPRLRSAYATVRWTTSRIAGHHTSFSPPLGVVRCGTGLAPPTPIADLALRAAGATDLRVRFVGGDQIASSSVTADVLPAARLARARSHIHCLARLHPRPAAASGLLSTLQQGDQSSSPCQGPRPSAILMSWGANHDRVANAPRRPRRLWQSALR